MNVRSLSAADEAAWQALGLCHQKLYIVHDCNLSADALFPLFTSELNDFEKTFPVMAMSFFLQRQLFGEVACCTILLTGNCRQTLVEVDKSRSEWTKSLCPLRRVSNDAGRQPMMPAGVDEKLVNALPKIYRYA